MIQIGLASKLGVSRAAVQRTMDALAKEKRIRRLAAESDDEHKGLIHKEGKDEI